MSFADPLYDPTAPPRIITWTEALERGYTRSAVQHLQRTGRWRRILPRVYLTDGVLTERARYDAALAYAGPGALLSGAAALRCDEAVRVAQPRDVLVLVPPGNRHTSHEWVMVRRTYRRAEQALAPGPKRVGQARAVADHALTLRQIDDVRAAVAEVVSRGGCTTAELRDELDAGPRQGSALLRQALDEVGESRSTPEMRAATVLRRAGCGDFQQNVRVPLAAGGYYEADFLWPQLRAILEIDSIEYHLGPTQWRATMDRHLVLTTMGYSVIHRPPSALRDEARFVGDVRAWLAGREAELRLA